MVVAGDRGRRHVGPEVPRLVDDDVVVHHHAVGAQHRLQAALHEGVEHEKGVAVGAQKIAHCRDLGLQQRHLRPRHDQHRAAVERVGAAQQRYLLDLVIQGFQGVARLGHAVALVHDGLAAQAVRVPGLALHVVVRLGAEGVRLAVAVEETEALVGVLRDAQDAVGDVDLLAAVHLHGAAPALQHGGAGELHAAHARLRRVDHRVVEVHRHQRRLIGNQLVQLDRRAQQGIVEEDDVHGIFEAPQHGDGLLGQRVQALVGEVVAQRVEDRQVRHHHQHAHHAEGVQGDLRAAAVQQGADVAAQRHQAPHHQHGADDGERQGPHRRLQQDGVHGQRGRQQGDPDQQNDARKEGTFHVNAANADNWC